MIEHKNKTEKFKPSDYFWIAVLLTAQLFFIFFTPLLGKVIACTIILSAFLAAWDPMTGKREGGYLGDHGNIFYWIYRLVIRTYNWINKTLNK